MFTLMFAAAMLLRRLLSSVGEYHRHAAAMFMPRLLLSLRFVCYSALCHSIRYAAAAARRLAAQPTPRFDAATLSRADDILLPRCFRYCPRRLLPARGAFSALRATRPTPLSVSLMMLLYCCHAIIFVYAAITP